MNIDYNITLLYLLLTLQMLFYLTTLPEGDILQPRLYVKQSMSRGTHVKLILYVKRTFYKIFPEIFKFEKDDSLFKSGQTQILYLAAIFKYRQEYIFSRVSLQKSLIQPSKYKNNMLTSLKYKCAADKNTTDMLFHFNTDLNCNLKQTSSSFVFSQTFWLSWCRYQLSNIHVGVNSNFHDWFAHYLQERLSFFFIRRCVVFFCELKTEFASLSPTFCTQKWFKLNTIHIVTVIKISWCPFGCLFILSVFGSIKWKLLNRIK